MQPPQRSAPLFPSAASDVYRGQAIPGGTQHCVAHGGGKRCKTPGCSKAVARARGSTLCTLCLRATQPQPDGVEAQQPSAHDLPLSLREREAIQRLVEDFA